MPPALFGTFFHYRLNYCVLPPGPETRRLEILSNVRACRQQGGAEYAGLVASL